MNEDILKGKWTQLKWLFKEAFGELTDDEILELEWNSDKAYDNPYWDNYEDWIYVDIIDGTPLFSSTDKYKSNTGWPSFTQPISDWVVDEVEDNLLWFTRIEARGATSDSHLWHIFTDGPQDEWGLRYCMNSASLKFIPKAELQEEWLAQYLYLFE